MIVYVLGGLWSAFVFTFEWREKGCAFSRQWLELAIIAFILWPLIWAEDSIQTIRNRERSRIAKARRRV